MRINVIIAIVVVISTAFATKAYAYTVSTSAPYAAILDYNSDAIIFERNVDERMFPSSMSKLMTLYVIFSKIKSGMVHSTDVYEVSPEAEEIGGSTMFLKAGQRVSVQDLINGVIVTSGNDASIVLAEGSCGDQKVFVSEMNDMARRLGMKNSHFVNATGWPDPDHYTTPRDMLILAKALFDDFPEHLPLFSQKEMTFNRIKQKNRNSLLWTNAEVNGLKTGYTDAGGYGAVITAILDNRFVILVINGLKTESTRHQEARKLLDYVFNNFETKRLFKKGEPVHEANVWMGKAKKVPLAAREDINIIYDKANKEKIKVSIKYQDPIFVPIFRNQKLGEMHIEVPGLTPKVVELFAMRDVEELSTMGRTLRNLSNIFGFS